MIMSNYTNFINQLLKTKITTPAPSEVMIRLLSRDWDFTDTDNFEISVMMGDITKINDYLNKLLDMINEYAEGFSLSSDDIINVMNSIFNDFMSDTSDHDVAFPLYTVSDHVNALLIRDDMLNVWSRNWISPVESIESYTFDDLSNLYHEKLRGKLKDLKIARKRRKSFDELAKQMAFESSITHYTDLYNFDYKKVMLILDREYSSINIPDEIEPKDIYSHSSTKWLFDQIHAMAGINIELAQKSFALGATAA